MAYKRNESEAQRLDRNFNEQLQELRIAQAGVQILFAFLLTIPFQQRFSAITDLQRGIYLVALMAAAVSVIAFTAPVALHRTLFREGLKDFIVSYTSRLMAVGLIGLVLAIVGGIVLVLDVLLSHVAAFVTGAVLLLVAVVLWILVPLSKKGTARRARPPEFAEPD
ncbi:DUF6328 family protein [Intrasporangium sp.]|jgi:hypothetical protein|uniref:DUF6328 family protein n=1 Tax=Intrasporangium sp. TaxID=1925024 RepID=UPI00336591AD